MKKILLAIVLAILLGGILGIYSYRKLNLVEEMPVMNTLESVYAIQIGVFNNLDNANKMAREYNGITIIDNDKYRVYIAIASNSLNILKDYYDSKGISYVIKNISVKKEFYTTLREYESMFDKVSKDSYDTIIKSILKEYEDIIYENKY